MSTVAPSTTAAWSTVLLGEHLRFLRRGIHSRADLGTDGPVLNLHYGDIHTAKRAHLDGLSFGQLPTLTREQAAGLDLLQDGDLVLADASEDLVGVGKAVEIRRLGDRSAVAGMHTIAARLDKATFADGFKAYLQHIPDFRIQVARMAAGTKVYGITRTHVAAVSLPVPPIGEQQSIAEALSDADALIESLEQLIAKKRLIKQGVMQELLTGKRRLPGFEGEWHRVRLGDVSTMSSGGTPPSKNSAYYGGQIPWVAISDMTAGGRELWQTERYLTESGVANSAAALFPAGTVLYAMYASLGECCIAAVPMTSSQAILGIRTSPALNSMFLYYFLSHIKSAVKLMGQQGTQANLNKGMVQDFTIPLPSVAEQRSIAALLNDMDDHLEAIGRQLETSRLIKQGMMQQLLTGRIRLL